MKLSDNLKKIRKEHNLSQEQLAEKIGVSRQAVSKWESGQSYPEMDKVLLICKLFNYNIDELMNENIKEVDETKQSKLNTNKYVDDFFSFITKTVDMLGSMRFKEKLKCFMEQVIIVIILMTIFLIIGSIGSNVVIGIFGELPDKMYNLIYGILQSIYLILSFVVGVTVLLHIFKVRYLDYYEIIKDDNNVNEEEKPKIVLEKNKEKIIIRDEKHSQSKFLTGIMKSVLWCIKCFAVLVAIGFAFTFVSFVVLLILSFLFVKTGFVFVGAFLGIVSALVVNFIVLELLYNFIISKKTNKTKLAICLISSLVLCGIGIGMIFIGLTNFSYVENNDIVQDVYEMEMRDNLIIGGFYTRVSFYTDIEYIETDREDVRVEINHSKYDKVDIDNNAQYFRILCYRDNSKSLEFIRDVINDLNNKQFKDYDDVNESIYVYASKANLEKIEKNRQNYFLY